MLLNLQAKETKVDLELTPESNLMIHWLLTRIPDSILFSLDGLSIQEWEYLILVICSNDHYFASREECGRMVMKIAYQCYRTLRLQPKDKLNEI